MGSSDLTEIRAREGVWFISDAYARPRMIQAGAQNYEGSVPSREMNEVMRKLLIPAMRELVQMRGGQFAAMKRQARIVGVLWEAEVHPIVSPDGSRLTGTLARYMQLGERSQPRSGRLSNSVHGAPVVPDQGRPAVGSWEWRVPRHRPDAGVVYWSDAMFELMGMKLPEGGAGPYPAGRWWHAAEFFDDMLGFASKMALRARYELSLIDDSDQLRTMVYPTHNRSTSEIMVLRQAGWLEIDEHGTRTTRGVTSVPEDRERALELAVRSGESDVIGAYMSVLPRTGAYMAHIDSRAHHIWTAPSLYADLGLHRPPDRSLHRIVHPADLRAVLTLARFAAASHGEPRLGFRRAEPSGPVPARLRRTDGSWLAVSVNAIGTRLTDYEHNAVLTITRAG